ncbi:lasso peptide biosynthesis B2 protein [Spirosoma flavum]|uniref:Lasso peptide biosynthesis B2 protein n=1 Tax=Spirosoma flavum TaxID=2048557 RepID=A0ABW6AFA9_9BACT
MKNLSKLAHNTAKFAVVSRNKKWLLVKVFFVLTIYKFLLFVFPFNQFFKEAKNLSYTKKSPSVNTLNTIVWAINSVSNNVPLGFTCLVQALSAKWLLKNHPDVRVCIGVNKSTTQDFSAHAWVIYKNRIILGEQTTQRFEPILEWN